MEWHRCLQSSEPRSIFVTLTKAQVDLRLTTIHNAADPGLMCKEESQRRCREGPGSAPCSPASFPTGLAVRELFRSALSSGALDPSSSALLRTLVKSTSPPSTRRTDLATAGMLIVGRVINGLSVGICSAQVPVYITELAPPSKRGRLVGAQQWAITWGIMIMFYISFGTSYIDGAAAFRIPWGLQMIPAMVLFVGLLFLPESPRWLAKKDRWEDCHAVLTLVHGKGNTNSPFVQREMREIRDMCEFERKQGDVSFMELFKPNMIK